MEKKEGFNGEARALLGDLRENLGLEQLTGLRLIHRYDVTGISQGEYREARDLVFAEPAVDRTQDEELEIGPGETVFAVEYLPGQYDQRADSAAQCLQLLTRQERPRVNTARVIALQGDLTGEELQKVKDYLVNPVECREASLEKPGSLEMVCREPGEVPVLQGFNDLDRQGLQDLGEKLGLAMGLPDLAFCQGYFREEEKRDPTLTEIRVLDTYWSDHCRHTTFLTEIEEVVLEEGPFMGATREAYHEYLASRRFVYGEEGKEGKGGQAPGLCLMDIALMAMRELKKRGRLEDLEESEEINACSIKVKARVNGREEDWLVMFKNETHNHPTEIEPFGGAATCLGGAIRDPLSGRSYLYQAMRVTGSGDPRVPVEETLPGKLPQRKITTGAAAGYSSYGNQVGLATGQVAEFYHPGFVAKRMEIGAVIGAAPRENVTRERPAPGDAVILVGGRTGRDGCGGATGSSKEHTLESLYTCGAEVQKGDPPTERKIQRLFRDPRVSRRIKKCNDFGAGGVSVAIGELAEGLEIDLDAVPKKYQGLDGTELAISESQERMAVVIAPGHVEGFIRQAREENLEATVVARVTGEGRLRMSWRGRVIVDLDRAFLDTSGVRQKTRVQVVPPGEDDNYFFQLPGVVEAALPDLEKAWLANLGDLNVCSQKGLMERFDSTVGAGTVLMPLGGRHQLTPAEGMVALLPCLGGETETATAMTFGYNPYLAAWSPFHGGLFAVVEAAARAVALGVDYRGLRLTLQEYFEKLGREPRRWGKPFSALLGAFLAQKRLGIPAVGGKDSMSGTFLDLHVPPTLVAFGVGLLEAGKVVSREFKRVDHPVVLLPAPRGAGEMPDFKSLAENFERVHRLIQEGRVLAVSTVRGGGMAAALTAMALGNNIGMEFTGEEDPAGLFTPDHGSLLLEMDPGTDLEEALAGLGYRRLGFTREKPVIALKGWEISLEAARAAWEEPLENVFPRGTAGAPPGEPPPYREVYKRRNTARPRYTAACPRVFIPVFPGTNCEYDTARAFQKAGGEVDSLVIRNLTPGDIEESVGEIARRMDNAQIIVVPGGFSCGDEPEGSGKFIAVMFRNPRIRESVTRFLQERDGLMLGICNGFQALIKLGLVPYGEIIEPREDAPTLTFNLLGRHVSCLARTRVTSVLSPWFARVEPGEVHTLPVSHGEGRFVAGEKLIQELFEKGQVATQYVDLQGNPSMDICYNPNGSLQAVEGITSPDGRILGKMAHSERTGPYLAANVPGKKEQPIFAAGVDYFR